MSGSRLALLAAAPAAVMLSSVAALASDSAVVTVSVDVADVAQDMGNRPWLAELYRSLLVRITDEGLAVVGSGEPADLRLKVVPIDSHAVSVSVQYACLTDASAVELGAVESAAAGLPVLHASLEKLRMARGALESAAATCDARRSLAVPPQPQPPPPPPPPPQRGEQPALSLEADGQALLSPGAASLLTRFHTLYGSDTGLAWQGALSLAKPFATDRRLDIWEWGCQAGGRYSRAIAGSWLSFQGELLLGYWQHRYAFTPLSPSSGAADRGTRSAAAFSLHGGVAAELASGVSVAVLAGGVLVVPAVVHQVKGAELWKATPVRAAAGLSLSWRL